MGGLEEVVASGTSKKLLGFRVLDVNEVTLEPNYRQSFNLVRLKGLAKSIERKGVLKPILVNKNSHSKHTVVAGQRRFLATLLANVAEIPVMVYKELSQEEILQIQMAENTQEKIPHQEIAESVYRNYLAYLSLESGFSLRYLDGYDSYWDIPKKIGQRFPLTRFALEVEGRDESFVSRAFRYHRLHANIKRLVDSGKLKYSVAAELGRIERKKEQMQLAERLVQQGKRLTGKSAAESVTRYMRSKQRFNLEASEIKDTLQQHKAFRSFCEDLKLTLNGFAMIYLDDPDFRRYTKEKMQDIIASIGNISPLESRFESAFVLNGNGKKHSIKDRILSRDITLENALQKGMYAKSKVRQLPVGIVIEDPENPRRTYNQESLESMADSMKVLGQLEPIMVTPIKRRGETYYMIVHGHRRRKAAMIAGLKKLKSMVVEGLTKAEIRVLQHEEDRYEEVPLGQRAMAIYRMKDILEKLNGKVPTIDELVRKNPGIGRKAVSNALSYAALDQRVRDLESAGALPYTVAVEIAKSRLDPDEQYEWALKSAVFRWNSSKFKENRKKSAVPKEQEQLFAVDKSLGRIYEQLVEHLAISLKGYRSELQKMLEKKRGISELDFKAEALSAYRGVSEALEYFGKSIKQS